MQAIISLLVILSFLLLLQRENAFAPRVAAAVARPVLPLANSTHPNPVSAGATLPSLNLRQQPGMPATLPPPTTAPPPTTLPPPTTMPPPTTRPPPATHPQPTPTYDTIIRFAANDRASIFIDGVKEAKIEDYSQFINISKPLPAGTVISFEVTNTHGWGGIVADIFYRGTHYVTGYHIYRASQETVFHQGASWKTPAFSSCDWQLPYKVGIKQTDPFAPFFPYTFGAKYVWAVGARRQGKIFLRFVLGGENCPSPTWTPSPSPVPFRQCACKQSTTERQGVCYYFTGPTIEGSKRRPCMKRTCEAKFECVESEETNRCIMKYTTSEVKMVERRFQDTYICEESELAERRYFLIPYA